MSRRVKDRKSHRGKGEGNATRGNRVTYEIEAWINNGAYLDPEEATDAAHAQAGKVPKKPTRQGKR
jgi:hypothetical protein